MTKLRHAIGKSTLVEGFAVPKRLEDWIRAPNTGEKRNIRLIYGERETKAILRRLANASGHVQVKYGTENNAHFRRWLNETFNATKHGAAGEYLELVRLQGDTFRVDVFPRSSQPSRRLIVAEWELRQTDAAVFQTSNALHEILAIVQSVEFSPEEGQKFYNQLLRKAFREWNWDAEKAVHPELSLRCDFAKDSVFVEVEFGNARTYYQDYVKFMLAFKVGSADLGILMVPTASFAGVLCDIGRANARKRGRRYYSGMIDLPKVKRELPHLDFMLHMPLAIAGIDISEQSPLATE